jgi:hypothetical protein
MAKKADKILPIKNQPSVDEAKKVLEAEKTRITKACAEEVNEVIKKHKCKMEVSFSFTPAQGPRYSIMITPID